MDTKEFKSLIDMLHTGNDLTDYAREKLNAYMREQESNLIPRCKNPNPPCSVNMKFGVIECTECDWSEV